MKRLIVLASATLALTVPAANAAAASGPTMAQFKALQAQLKKDEKKIQTLQNEADFAVTFQLCQNAVTADAFQGTWQSIDALAVSLAKPAIFGPQTPISDLQSCGAFRNPIVRSQTVPPTTSVFSALAALLANYNA
jgi:hypothetical protein